MMLIAQVPRPFNLEISRSCIPGYVNIAINGVNPAVGRTAFEDIWDFGGNFVFPTAGETWEVVSDSTSDTLLGTGARTVSITGLDVNYVEQEETVNLNGTTPVVTTRTDWFRIREVIVTSSGSGQENAGNITIRVSGGGLTRSLIRTGNSKTYNGFFTVPAGKTLLIQYRQIPIPKNGDATVSSEVLIDGTNTFVKGNDLPIYQNELHTLFTSLPVLIERTDIRFTAKSTNTSVSVTVVVEATLADSTSFQSNLAGL